MFCLTGCLAKLHSITKSRDKGPSRLVLMGQSVKHVQEFDVFMAHKYFLTDYKMIGDLFVCS